MLRLTGSLGRVRSRNGRLRGSATVAYVGKPLKGFRFSREALQASVPLWIGDPIMLGDHLDGPHLVADFTDSAENPVVGRVADAVIDDDGGFRLIGEYNSKLKPALQAKGYEHLEDLPGEVSLELVPEVIGRDADGIVDAGVQHTNGFVLLTSEKGACSRADGCGLHLSDSCNCSNCKEENLKKEHEELRDAIVTGVGEAMKTAFAEALKAAGDKGEGTDPKGGSPPQEKSADATEAEAKAKAYDEIMTKRRDAIVDELVKTGRYSDTDRDALAKIDVSELEERLRLLTTEDEQEKLAASAGGRVLSGLFTAPPKGSDSDQGEGVKGKGGSSSAYVPQTWEEKQRKWAEA